MSRRPDRAAREKKPPRAASSRPRKNPVPPASPGAHEHAHPHDHAHSRHAHSHPHSHTKDAAHAHGHSHAESHAHPHDHSHAEGRAHVPARAPEAHRSPLAEGAGHGKTLFLDAPSGIAGDMTIAALVDLGVPLSVVERAIGKLQLAGVSVRLEAAYAGAIGASRFVVEVTSKQPERRYAEIDRMIERADLPSRVKDLARAVFLRLGEAEAEVHRISLAEVHFHEVGAVDAIVDIVGAAACFAHLGADVACSPLPLGHGFVECRHGILPLPAPAAVACLRGVPTYDARLEAELVTPTGAAIVGTVARRFESWPSIVPERIGWGAGTRVLPDRPNALRAVLGARTDGGATGSDRAPTHVVVETNLDDATGELAGHAMSVLLASGALDAWAAPVTMKKGRPGIVLSALAPAADAHRVAELMLRETSSIGVRYAPVRRVERPREMRVVKTPFGEIPVKVSGGPYGAPVVKPEFDACVEAAERAGVAVRVVLEAALHAASVRAL